MFGGDKGFKCPNHAYPDACHAGLRWLGQAGLALICIIAIGAITHEAMAANPIRAANYLPEIGCSLILKRVNIDNCPPQIYRTFPLFDCSQFQRSEYPRTGFWKMLRVIGAECSQCNGNCRFFPVEDIIVRVRHFFHDVPGSHPVSRCLTTILVFNEEFCVPSKVAETSFGNVNISSQLPFGSVFIKPSLVLASFPQFVSGQFESECE